LSSTALAMAEEYIRDRFPEENGKSFCGGKQYKVSDDA